MKELWSAVSNFYSSVLRPEAIYVVNYLANSLSAVVVLIAIIVVLSIVRAKFLKNNKWRQLVDFVAGMIAVLLLIVAWYSFSPQINKFFKYPPSSSPIKSTTTPGSSTSGTTTQPSTSTYKQLYYSVGCYDCYADSCVRNGYSYGGYDVNYYNYIRNLCRSCSCSSYRAQSFWR